MIPDTCWDFLFTATSITVPVLEPNQSPRKLVCGFFLAGGIKGWPDFEAYHSALYKTEVKSVWSFIFMPYLCLPDMMLFQLLMLCSVELDPALTSLVIIKW
jgi:hypothetical protein